MPDQLENLAVLRLPGVIAATGLSKSVIYRRVKAGTFPRPIDLGGRAVGWRRGDVAAWLTSRPRATGEAA